jgi:hypothetical protein
MRTVLWVGAALWMAGAAGAPVYSQTSVLAWHNDNARTGQNLRETALTPANVNASAFGRLFTIVVDGKVDAQPLYVPGLTIRNQGTHNVLFVVTEHDSVYAFDADTGTQLWRVSLLLAGESPSDDRGCGQVSPEIGITSTPVIDPQMGPNGTIYVVAMSQNGSTYHQRLHALDLTTLNEQFGGPVEVQATYPGTGDGSVGGVLTFDQKQYKERAGLLIVNGVVYTSWASHCDIVPYTAWVIGYNEANLSRVSVLNLTPNGSDGSVWESGAGPAADASGNIYLLMANGTFDTALTSGGYPNKADYGNAFVKIAAGGNSVADYFTMSNTVQESNVDEDLGSGGAMLLPPLSDALGRPQDLAVGAGKDRNIYVVNRTNMGKFNPNANAIYQELPAAVGQVFSSPAWFNGTLYYGGVDDHLKAFGFSNGVFGTNPTSQTTNSFGYPGTTPSISANGTTNGIVWAAENGNTAVLHAYDAGDLSKELYNSNQAANARDDFGAGNKFIVPTVVNGKVYVGTTTGVGVFGLLSRPAADADFDGNGKPDLVWQDDASRTPVVWYMGGTDGSTILSGKALNGPSPGWRIVATADFDGNGKPDLVWQDDTSRTAVVWYMGGTDGSTILSGKALNGPFPGWRIVATADFDGNGKPDLVWQDDTSRTAVVWYMGGTDGSTILSGKALNGPVPGWRIVVTADFDGNGKPDLVWQDDTSRTAVVWYMGGTDGSTILSGKALNGPVPGWTIAGPK